MPAGEAADWGQGSGGASSSNLVKSDESRCGGSPAVIWAVLGILALTGAAVAVFWLVILNDPANLREDQLIRILESDTPEDPTPVVVELSRRGESQIPRIEEAFARANGQQVLQVMLADSVRRIYPPSVKTIESLERMHESSRDPEVSREIENFIEDCRIELDQWWDQ